MMLASALLALSPALLPQAQVPPRFELRLQEEPFCQIGETRIPGLAEAVTFSKDGKVDLAQDKARLTFGPHPALGVTSQESFTLELELRSEAGGFSTPLMCREGPRVHYSLVMGRQPGRLAFEAWSWQRDKAISAKRVDDGCWHRIQAAYDADSRSITLLVDGEFQALVPISAGFEGSQRPSLRLGNNLDGNVHQPFPGQLCHVGLRPGIPKGLANLLELRRQTQVLEPGAAKAAMQKWLLRLTRPRKPKVEVGDPAAWQRRRRQIQAGVQDALGLWPPPYAAKKPKRLGTLRSPLMGAAGAKATNFASFESSLPLDRKNGGSLERQGYRLSRIYYQSFVGYHAGGWLYEPTDSWQRQDHKLPAVLCPHGHWQHGARHPVVQARCITLARNGYVVLAVDSVHLQDDASGLSPLSLMMWNNLRGLELLRHLPQVDPNRIAATGASGGGQQTYYLTALRSGLCAAVPAVMACHFEEIIRAEGVHCYCNHVPHLMALADQPEMSAVFAPRPQLFLSVTGDWTRRFPKHGLPAIRRVYEALGAAGKVEGRQWESKHDYNRSMRNAMYAFLERHLKGKSKPNPTLEPADLGRERLQTLRALEVPDIGQDTKAVIREFRQRLAVGPQPAAAARQRLAWLFGSPARAHPELTKAGSFTWRGHRGHCYRLQGAEEIQTPFLLLHPKAGKKKAAAQAPVLLISSAGKTRLLFEQAPWVLAFLDRGHPVVLADLRYTGELDVAGTWREPYGRFFGRDEGIVAVQDLWQLYSALPRLPGLGGQKAMLVAFGDHGAAALYAAALDPRVSALVVVTLGPSYADAARRPRISRILLHGDLPVAARLMAPRPLLMGGCQKLEAFGRSKGQQLQERPLSPAQVIAALRDMRR